MMLVGLKRFVIIVIKVKIRCVGGVDDLCFR